MHRLASAVCLSPPHLHTPRRARLPHPRLYALHSQALSRYFSDGHDMGGARPGVAFIFLYSALCAGFFNSALYAIAAETFPSIYAATALPSLRYAGTSLRSGWPQHRPQPQQARRFFLLTEAVRLALGQNLGAFNLTEVEARDSPRSSP